MNIVLGIIAFLVVINVLAYGLDKILGLISKLNGNTLVILFIIGMCIYIICTEGVIGLMSLITRGIVQ